MPRSNSFYVIFILNVIFVLFVNKTSALTEAQRKEVEKLRAELDEAFENYEEEDVAAAGVVVQPGWTQNSDKPAHKIKTKVKLTKAGIKEAEQVRAEINKAVKQDAYVNSDSDARLVHELVNELSLRDQGKSALETMVAKDGKTADHAAEQVGAATPEESHSGPNTVEATAFEEQDIDVRKLQRLEVSKRRTREMLVLKSVEEDYSFDLGDDVAQWAHILHNGREYFIGRRDVNLLIVRKDTAKYEHAKVLEVGQHISYLETYSFWNLEQQQQEGVMLVASADKVLWYRGNNETGQIELYWEWVIGSTISGLTHFVTENNNYLVISSNESSRTGYYALNIYQFELKTKEFWIVQRMQLQFPCVETTVVDTGRDIILATPQNNSAAIYTFNPRADATDHIRFRLRRQVPSEGIESVAGFQMGGRTYLALGGLQPQILVYQQGDLVPKTILGHNFGLVQLFFPVPVRTYRDDLILLVQHRVDFGTHGLTVLETLIWDGEAFEASIPVPCLLGDHTAYGVSCMLDIQRDAGLKGAALLRRGDEVSIIVPRFNAESGLFRLHTELLAKNSELLDLQEIFAFLKDWVQEQDDLIAQAQAFLDAPDDGSIQTQPDLSELEFLETPELVFDGEVGEIYVNDHKWTAEDTSVDLEHIINVIEQLEQDLKGVRPKREIPTIASYMDTMDMDSVEVEELLVDQVNNERFYIQDGALDYEGTLTLHDLQVLESINVRAARETEDELLRINGHLKFDEINGIPWREISENLVFRNEPLELARLEVDGEVIVEDTVKVDVLNSLNFPDDFLWSSGPTVSVVHAQKTFVGTLSANAVDTNGFINGVNPFDAISLSNAQNWTDTPTFSHLTVSEIFELNGTLRGEGFENLPKNPTLRESSNITANCYFKNLEVRGPLRLVGKFNETPLAPLLADIVRRPADPSDEIVIRSKKTFSTVALPIDFNVETGKINDIPIENFVTKHTEQELTTTTLLAYIYFHNLTLSGRYDGVDIAELAQNAIKIDEPHVMANSTQLNFSSTLNASAVHVLDTLNGVSLDRDYQTVLEDIEMPAAHFEQLQAKVADIPNDIKGSGRLNGVKLREFLQRRTSTEPGASGNVHIDELSLGDGMEADQMHGIEAAHLFDFLKQIDDLPEMILDGKIEVDHVVVTGDVQLNKLNNQSFDEDLQLTVIWLNRPNYLSTSLQFMEPLHVHGNLVVEGNYNGQNLPALLADMVFRNPNGSTLISAPKNFAKNVHVLGDTKLEAINSVPFSAIATKKTIGNFKGSLRINGNLVVDALELTGALNGYPMSALSSAVRFDRHLQTFVLQGVTSFETEQYLQDLTVYGDLNEMPSLAQFFNSLVYKNKIVILRGKNVFTGRVSIEKGAYIRSLNGHNLMSVLENIVYVNEATPVVVNSPIVFKGPLKAQDVTVQSTLKTSNLNGCSLAEWLQESLRVDRNQEITERLLFAPGSLNGNAFYVSFLNDVDLSQVITLHTEQNLTGNLFFPEVYLDGQIVSLGPINNVDLQQAYQNTLLTHGNQHVSTPLTLQGAEVLQHLQINVPVNNDKDLQQLATLSGDLEFESPLLFQNVTTRNLRTEHLVSGINLEQWFRDSLWVNKQPQQFIRGNWSVRNLTVNSGPSLPSYMVTGLQTQPLNALLRKSRAEDAGYESLCQKVGKFVSKQQRRGIYLKHLERSFKLRARKFGLENEKLRQAFVLATNGDNYLLMNAGCMTSILMWNPNHMQFEQLGSYETGWIEEVLLVSSSGATIEFVTNAASDKQSSCNFGGLNVWRLDEANNLTHLKAFEEPVDELHIPNGQLGELFAVDGHRVYAYNLSAYKVSNTWPLPVELGNSNYRFVPHALEPNRPMLTNGDWIVVLNNRTSQRNKRTMPLHSQRAAGSQRDSLTESILKPKTRAVHQFVFADFRQLVQSILVDLVQRLHLEINVTQLSIPETDLYDEHLAQDFLDIMQELQKQKIYPSSTFAALNLSALQLPSSPAQVLAARTVQITWPVIVDIEEIHGYLRSNETKEHPVCAAITQNLGVMIRDVLLLANANGESSGHVHKLTAVIERIHQFQSLMEHTVKELDAEASVDVATPNSSEPYEMSETQITADIELPSANNAADFDSLEHDNDTWLKFSTKNLPSKDEGELLALEVSSADEPHHLLAATFSKAHLVAGQHGGIALYLDVLRGSRFQTIEAHKPRALATLRVRHETLLAYVEGCCAIRVLIYRGVQGFVQFTHFKSANRVLALLSFALPGGDHIWRYHLATVHSDGLEFYELIVAGANMVSPQPFVCA